MGFARHHSLDFKVLISGIEPKKEILIKHVGIVAIFRQTLLISGPQK